MPHLISDLGQIAIGLKPPDTTVRMPQVVKLDVVADLERISRLCYQRVCHFRTKWIIWVYIFEKVLIINTVNYLSLIRRV